ncbi:MAG: hypothetical protein RhofKO_29420 [Rhodothermales bacterium]
MKAKSISWKVLLLESGFIVLGVVIALGANELRQSFRDQARADEALVSIGTELCRNHLFLDERLTYYQTMQDTLFAAYPTSADEPFTRRNFPQFRGAMPLLLTSASFEVALASDVMPHLDLNQVDSLAQVYELQRMVTVFQERFLEAALNKNMETVAEHAAYFSEMTSFGSELRRFYLGALRSLPATHEACLNAVSPDTATSP